MPFQTTGEKVGKFHDDLSRLFEQLATRLEQDARQPRLAMEADRSANTKTRERTEGAATAVQTMHGGSVSAYRVDPGPKTSTSFCVKTEPPALPCRDDVVVESGDTAPKSCLPSLEMRSLSVAGGLLSAGDTSTATETTVNEALLHFFSTEEETSKKKKLWTSIPSAWYDGSFWKLLAAPSCLNIIETISGENMTFDPGGSQGHFRACLVLGSWRALLCGEVIRARAAG